MTKSEQIERMRLVITEDYEEMSQTAADMILTEIRKKPDALLSIATGDTPKRAYALLADQFQQKPELFDRLRLVKLDEWGGLAPDDPATCETFIRDLLIKPLKVAADRYFGWKSNPVDPEQEVGRMTRLIDALGDIDVNILGLGLNGHLGFNEPASQWELRPHATRLSASTLGHSMAKVAKAPIGYGLTLGIGEIMRSRKVILLVNGSHKVEPLQRFLKNPAIDPQIPASILWLHPDCTVIADRFAVPDLV